MSKSNAPDTNTSPKNTDPKPNNDTPTTTLPNISNVQPNLLSTSNSVQACPQPLTSHPLLGSIINPQNAMDPTPLNNAIPPAPINQFQQSNNKPNNIPIQPPFDMRSFNLEANPLPRSFGKINSQNREQSNITQGSIGSTGSSNMLLPNAMNGLFHNIDDPDSALSNNNADSNIQTQYQTIMRLNWIAGSLASNWDFENAIKYYKKIVTMDDENGPAWTALGHCYLITDNLQKAFEAYQKALYTLNDIRDPQLWYGIGLLYDKFESYEHAVSSLMAVLKLNPAFVQRNEALYKLGFIFAKTGHIEEAITFFHNALLGNVVSINRKLDILYKITNCHLEKNEYEKAIKSLSLAKSIDENNYKSYMYEAWINFASKEYIKAQECLEKAQTINNTDPDISFLQARIAIDRDDNQKAVEYINQAISRSQENALYWCTLGILNSKTKNYREAFENFIHSTRCDSSIIEVWYNLGILYEICEQGGEALKVYQKAEEINPEYKDINKRIEMLKKGEKTNEPLVHLQPEFKITNSIKFLRNQQIYDKIKQIIEGAGNIATNCIKKDSLLQSGQHKGDAKINGNVDTKSINEKGEESKSSQVEAKSDPSQTTSIDKKIEQALPLPDIPSPLNFLKETVINSRLPIIEQKDAYSENHLPSLRTGNISDSNNKHEKIIEKESEKLREAEQRAKEKEAEKEKLLKEKEIWEAKEKEKEKEKQMSTFVQMRPMMQNMPNLPSMQNNPSPRPMGGPMMMPKMMNEMPNFHYQPGYMLPPQAKRPEMMYPPGYCMSPQGMPPQAMPQYGSEPYPYFMNMPPGYGQMQMPPQQFYASQPPQYIMQAPPQVMR